MQFLKEYFTKKNLRDARHLNSDLICAVTLIPPARIKPILVGLLSVALDPLARSDNLVI